MGVLLVVNVLSLGLQATGARRVSAAPESLPQIEHEVLGTSYSSALLLGLVVLLASPVIAIVLHLDSWAPAALVAVTAVPLSVMGGQAGILQGERRWGPLAGIYLAVGLGRLGFGTVALLIDKNTTGAMVGVTIGAFVPVVIGWHALRHPDRAHVALRTPNRDRPSLGTRWRAPRDGPQLPRPAGVLRALERRRDHRPGHAGRAPGGSVRRRADLVQGGAVPAAVRGRDRVPVDGEPGRRQADAPGQPRCGDAHRHGHHPRGGAAATARGGVRRRAAVLRAPGPAVGLRGTRHPARHAAADDLQHRRPAATAHRPAGVDGVPGALRLHAVRQLARRAADRGLRGRPAVHPPAGAQPHAVVLPRRHHHRSRPAPRQAAARRGLSERPRASSCRCRPTRRAAR